MGYLFSVMVSVFGEVMVGFQRFAAFALMSENRTLSRYGNVESWTKMLVTENDEFQLPPLRARGGHPASHTTNGGLSPITVTQHPLPSMPTTQNRPTTNTTRPKIP
ncbi:hypothetical protein Peur_016703 [Populus x canadensis]